MNLLDKLRRLERLPAPPVQEPERVKDCRIDGYVWRLYLNVMARSLVLQGQEDADAPQENVRHKEDDCTPEERARYDEDFRRILREAHAEVREPLTPEARAVLHSEMRRMGLSHLLDGEAA